MISFLGFVAFLFSYSAGFVADVADIRRSTRPFLEDKTEDDFFQIDVRDEAWLNY